MGSLIRAAQQVALEIRDQTYLSTILAVHEKRELVVRAPEVEGRPLSPPANAPIRLVVSQPGQPLGFFTRVLRSGPYAEEPAALYLAWPAAADRARKRRHVRVDVIAKAEATPQPRPGEPARPIGALTADLSEGGARLTLARPLAVASVVHLRLHIRAGQVFECAGRVVRAGETEEMLAPHRYWAAVEFVDVPEATRREIARLR